MANRRFTQFFYTFHNKPVLLDCNFVVDSTNANGLGLRSLKGPGIAAVLGNSTVPATGNNLAAGYFKVQFQDNYNRYYGGFGGFTAPLTGANVNVTAGLVIGTVYVITAVGTTTTAAWVTLGVPVGITPAPGVAFVAATAALGTGTGTVKLSSTSGIDSVEVLGDPNTTITSIGTAVGFNGGAGGYLLLQCLQDGVVTAPADGSVCWASFYLSSSSVLTAGE